MKNTLLLAASLLLASCTLFPQPREKDLTLEELAACVPAYGDATPVNSYYLEGISTIGELRAALAGGLDPNGSNGKNWRMVCSSTYDAGKRYSPEELQTQQLAFLDVMLRAGGDPQKARVHGGADMCGIAYALLIRHGLRADEPFTISPENLAKGDYTDETYPLNGLAQLPLSVIEWLADNGAPLNERFNGTTELMDLYKSLWWSVQKDDREAGARWGHAYRVTELLLAKGLDLSVADARGYTAIDYLPLAGDATEEQRAKYSRRAIARAEKLKQLLLAHGSPQRRAAFDFGEDREVILWNMTEEGWQILHETRLRQAREAHDAREARLAPQRAARRAAEAEKKAQEAVASPAP